MSGLLRGTIVRISKNRSRYAAETEEGEFVTFELTSAIDLFVGTGILGPLDAVGDQTFTTADGERFTVFVEIPGGGRVSALAWVSR